MCVRVSVFDMCSTKLPPFQVWWNNKVALRHPIVLLPANQTSEHNPQINPQNKILLTGEPFFNGGNMKQVVSIFLVVTSLHE